MQTREASEDQRIGPSKLPVAEPLFVLLDLLATTAHRVATTAETEGDIGQGFLLSVLMKLPFVRPSVHRSRESTEGAAGPVLLPSS
jgi:hypothetical protein